MFCQLSVKGENLALDSMSACGGPYMLFSKREGTLSNGL